jgi:Rrf2 family protein
MRISVRGRYALAAMISIAEYYDGGEVVSILSIAEKLGLSKIYLEQVFSLLKRGGIVTSLKGAQGGYQLARKPQQITLLDILGAVEQSLFEATESTVGKKAPELDRVMQEAVFDRLDQTVKNTLGQITLANLLIELEKRKTEKQIMFYI